MPFGVLLGRARLALTLAVLLSSALLAAAHLAPFVRRVAQRGDALRNGLIRGALAGVGFGLLADG